MPLSENTVDELVANSPVLDDLIGGSLDENELYASIEDLQRCFSREVLESMLPDPELRPLLLAAIISELRFLADDEPDISQDDSVAVQEQTLQTKSCIIRALRHPYKPVFIKDAIARFKGEDRESMGKVYDTLIYSEEEGEAGINDTLRNMILAFYINEQIMGDDHSAKLCLAQYTLGEQWAKINEGEMPELPIGTDKKTYVKLLIAITDIDDNVVEYIDYGQSEGQEQNGIKPTGEGLGSVIGRPTSRLIDPLDSNQVVHALKQIERSQNTEDDREAVRRIEQAYQLMSQ